jgi:hypothetical protein
VLHFGELHGRHHSPSRAKAELVHALRRVWRFVRAPLSIAG